MQETAPVLPEQVNARDNVFAGTLNRLRERAEQYFGTSPVEIKSLQQIEGPYSRVLHVQVQGSSQVWSAFVKRYKLQEENPSRFALQQQVLNEFSMLQNTAAALAQYHGLGVARPIACFPEEYSLVTEQAPGSTIRNVLNSPVLWRFFRKQRELLIDIFERAGMWVNAFQRTSRDAGKVSIPEIRDYIDVRLNTVVQHGAFTQAQRSALLRRFDAQSASVSECDLAEVPIHGDFCPHNVLASEAAITVIDIPSSVTGSIYYDLAHMFIHLENLKVRPWMGARLIEDVQIAMLRGFDRNLSAKHPLFQIELMRNLVSLLVQQQSVRASFPSRLYRSMIWRNNYRRFQKWLR